MGLGDFAVCRCIGASPVRLYASGFDASCSDLAIPFDDVDEDAVLGVDELPALADFLIKNAMRYDKTPKESESESERAIWQWVSHKYRTQQQQEHYSSCEMTAPIREASERTNNNNNDE
jgi:hypothetical protein